MRLVVKRLLSMKTPSRWFFFFLKLHIDFLELPDQSHQLLSCLPEMYTAHP